MVHPLVMSYTYTATQIVAPTTGQTVTIGNARCLVFAINPAGALLALTVNMPSNPQDGDEVSITSTQAITGVTMGGGTIVGNLTSLTLGGFGAFSYNASLSSWLRIG